MKIQNKEKNVETVNATTKSIKNKVKKLETKKTIKQIVNVSEYVQSNSNLKPGAIIKPAPANVKNYTVGPT